MFSYRQPTLFDIFVKGLTFFSNHGSRRQCAYTTHMVAAARLGWANSKRITCLPRPGGRVYHCDTIVFTLHLMKFHGR